MSDILYAFVFLIVIWGIVGAFSIYNLSKQSRGEK